MKRILTIAFLILAINSFAQTIKYKDIKPLLKEKKYDEALPKLISYYMQNLEKDGLFWKNKAILFEEENMYNAAKNIATIYYSKASSNNFESYADSSLFWYKVMVKDNHPEKIQAESKISELERIIQIKGPSKIVKVTENKKVVTSDINIEKDKNSSNNKVVIEDKTKPIENTESKQSSSKVAIVTVSGEGKTKAEALSSALRSAIEQAFGTFISSNTQVLNDELIKDEIVSVSNGNIQEYKIISEIQAPDGTWFNTVQAKVSIEKLTSFCESKGITVEFKGSLFAINIKQQALNEQNEITAVKNMCTVLKEISDRSFDFEIKAGEPGALDAENKNWKIPLMVNTKINSNFKNYSNYFESTLKGISLTQTEAANYKNLSKSVFILNFTPISSEQKPKIDSLNIISLRKHESLAYIYELILYLKHSISYFYISNGIEKITATYLLTCDFSSEVCACESKANSIINSGIYRDSNAYYINSIKENMKCIYDNNFFIDNVNAEDFKIIMDEYGSYTSIYKIDPGLSYNTPKESEIETVCKDKYNHHYPNKLDVSFENLHIGKNVASFSFNDIRSTKELEQISNYIVNPISNENEIKEEDIILYECPLAYLKFIFVAYTSN